jgi:hypothetical protein
VPQGVTPRAGAVRGADREVVCHAASVADFALIIRLDRPSYPFCIEELGAGGSRLIIERWATEALAADRLWDIKDEKVARDGYRLRRATRAAPETAGPSDDRERR